MKVEDIMSSSPECCRDDERLDTAVRRMRARDCGFLPVIDEDGFPIGVLTDRDVALAACDLELPLHEIEIGSAMSTNLHCCSRHDSVEDAERVMRDEQIRRLPVVDRAGRLVGILSLNDIALAEAWDGPIDAAVEVARTLADIGEHRVH